jgi:hypothetical protein
VSRVRTAGGPTVRVEYEIAVSTLLLFQTFREPGRPVVVGGLVCRDRLDALQRIMEHELLHLAEFSDTRGVKFLLNIDVESQADVDRMVPVALEAGATLIKPPYVTYYNWYQSVLLDPEGNVFRINFMM